jgi:hypothetical protein
MQIETYFNNLWYVHTNDGRKFESMWTSRREARARKTQLRARGETGVTVSFVPVSYGAIKQDDHS